MTTMSYWRVLVLAGPETIVALAALAILFLDLGAMRSAGRPARRLFGAVLTTVACGAGIFWTVAVPESGTLPESVLVIDPLTTLVRQALLVLTVFTAWLSVDSDFTDHIGEFFALILLATVGLMFMSASENLLMIFVSLELVSLSLYVLTAFNKQSARGAEAALKYFLFGGMAAAVMLFGLSLLYGFTGTIELKPMAAAIRGKGFDPMLALGLIMTLTGLGFKIAAVPFHLWAPDTYSGAPTPCAAFIGSGSKVASFVVLGKLLIVALPGVAGAAAWNASVGGWTPLLAALAVASMLLGNVAALAQTEFKRLLAYSAIAHGGYALLAVVAGNAQGMSALIYYVVTYALTTLGAFGCAAVIEARGGGTQIADFAGLARRSPVVSFCLLIFMLSLAGIPPLPGFFGKFYVFTAIVNSEPKELGLIWLIVIAIAMSTLSLYYYLKVLKQVYVAAPVNDSDAPRPLLASGVALGFLGLAVVLIGCLPDLLVGPLASALKAAGF